MTTHILGTPDCFGCCELPAGSGNLVWSGSEGPENVGSCNRDTLGDPTKCNPCIQVAACTNPCDTCETCIGRPTLPPGCATQARPAGAEPCGQPGQACCPSPSYCISGCCQPLPQLSEMRLHGVTLAVLVVGIGACAAAAPTERGAGPAPAASTAEPPLAGAVAIVASASAVPSPPSPPPLDHDMVDDEPTFAPERARLVALLRRSRHVVRGRVVEAKQKHERRAGRTVAYSYAIVDILEWLRGDAARVEATHRRGFALVTEPIPEGVSKMPAEHVRSFEDELASFVGKERLFLVDLPSEDGSASLEPGPPPFIVARWGKLHVGIVEHLAVDARADVAAAIADLARHDAWVAANAARLVIRDRWAGAKSADEAAGAVLAFVTSELAERAGLAMRGELPAGTEDRGVVRYAAVLEGSGASAKLGIHVDARTFRVRGFHLDPALARSRPVPRVPFGAARVLDETRRRLGLSASGGKLFTHAATATRGDGLSFLDVTLHAGMVQRGRVSHASRAVRVMLSADEAFVFDYVDAWAE